MAEREGFFGSHKAMKNRWKIILCRSAPHLGPHALIAPMFRRGDLASVEGTVWTTCIDY